MTRPRKPKPSHRREQLAAQRKVDFEAGLQAAKEAIGPVIMKRYFLRGLAVGALLCGLAIGAILAGLAISGTLMLR